MRDLVRTCVLALLLTAVMREGSAAPLPVFSSSDPQHDRLLNDLFIRHLRIDVSDTSLRKAPGVPVPTFATCTLWRDWEVGDTLWYDATSANFPHLEALAAGVPQAAAARSVLSWLDGSRVVDGDTSAGDDIYHWEFAARLSTKHNILDWGWGHAWHAGGGEEDDECNQPVASLLVRTGAFASRRPWAATGSR